eukprot:SAG31_NODE_34861_length_328_cov_1.087336_1_plen_26_part_01
MAAGRRQTSAKERAKQVRVLPFLPTS